MIEVPEEAEAIRREWRAAITALDRLLDAPNVFLNLVDFDLGQADGTRSVTASRLAPKLRAMKSHLLDLQTYL